MPADAVRLSSAGQPIAGWQGYEGDEGSLIGNGDPGTHANRASGITRRTLLQRAAGLGVSAATLSALDLLALAPTREALAARRRLPEIQYAIEPFIAPAVTEEGVQVRFGPLYSCFATFTLTRAPTLTDQTALEGALASIESSYPFSAEGVMMTLAYGMPYLQRLPAALVEAHMPRLRDEPQRPAFEEAIPSPTDVSPSNPEVQKERFNVPVQIERNELVLVLRSDSSQIIDEVLAWLLGEASTLGGATVGSSPVAELLSATSRRLAFTQIGLPRLVAEEQTLPYASYINTRSPMWMGFASQQTGTSGPPEITTFLGDSSARLTNARHGNYLAHASVMHLSHVILDLEQFYEYPQETYVRRVAEMFSADPPPRYGNTDQFTDGGGPAYIANVFSSPLQAQREAEGSSNFDGQRRASHTTALQRTSRASDRVPLHIRADAPGFDSLDVPEGLPPQPKLHFAIFVPTADFFARMRAAQAATDLAQRYGIPQQNLGIERFMTTTRRQNFLVPPRRRRAFPLLERALRA